MRLSFLKTGGVRTALAGMFFGVLAAPVGAFTIFHGGGFIGSFIGCESQGWNGVASVTARFMPAGLPENDPDDYMLVLQLGRGTHAYSFGGEIDSGNWADAEFWEVWSHLPRQVTDPQVRARLIGWASDLLEDASDPDLTIHALIENFNGLAGCTARLGLYLRRPDLPES